MGKTSRWGRTRKAFKKQKKETRTQNSGRSIGERNTVRAYKKMEKKDSSGLIKLRPAEDCREKRKRHERR